MSDQDRLADITRRYKPGVNDDVDYLLNQLTHAQMATERLRGLGQDGCPLCGSTRFTEEPVDVSSEGRARFTPGLRHCLDCHGGGAPVLLAEVERLRQGDEFSRMHAEMVGLHKGFEVKEAEVQQLRGLLGEVLTAYKEQAMPLRDEREPERYRRWAEELVAKVEAELAAESHR